MFTLILVVGISLRGTGCGATPSAHAGPDTPECRGRNARPQKMNGSQTFHMAAPPVLREYRDEEHREHGGDHGHDDVAGHVGARLPPLREPPLDLGKRRTRTGSRRP